MQKRTYSKAALLKMKKAELIEVILFNQSRLAKAKTFYRQQRDKIDNLCSVVKIARAELAKAK